MDSMCGVNKSEESTVEKRVDAVGWALFFIWTGVAFLAHISWGVGLIGVGAIMMGIQLARKYYHLGLQGFPVVIGSILILAGIKEIVGVQFSLLPFLCIAAGLALLLSLMKSGRKEQR
jgi:hypothetical protein